MACVRQLWDMCPTFGPESFIDKYDASGESYYRELESKNRELSRDLSVLMLRIEGLKEDVEQVCCIGLLLKLLSLIFLT